MALYSRGVITCLVCLNPQNPQRGTLIYVLGIIILIEGILVIEGVIEGIGIILCTLVSVFCFIFVLGGVGGTRYLFQVPCGYLFD